MENKTIPVKITGPLCPLFDRYLWCFLYTENVRFLSVPEETRQIRPSIRMAYTAGSKFLDVILYGLPRHFWNFTTVPGSPT